MQNDAEVYEIRKVKNQWRLFYPDEGSIETPFLCYDKENNVKSVIYAGGETGKLTQSFMEFNNPKEAIEYAKELGAQEIRLIKTGRKKKKKNG